jgi:hypothetical protein
VAINTTSFDFATGDFADRLLAKLALRGIRPAMIEVEVTESVVLGRGRDHVRQALVELAAAGVRISLDDFGTGYASLTNVKQLPITALKIDRSFVGGLGSETDDSIILAISTLGARMGLAMPRRPMPGTPASRARRRAAAPIARSARCNWKPNCAPIPSCAPTGSSTAGTSSAPVPIATTRPATWMPTRAPGLPWRTWPGAWSAIRSLNPSSPSARPSSGSP